METWVLDCLQWQVEAISQPELNIFNNPEVLEHSGNRRKSSFFRAMAKQYLWTNDSTDGGMSFALSEVRRFEHQWHRLFRVSPPRALAKPSRIGIWAISTEVHSDKPRNQTDIDYRPAIVVSENRILGTLTKILGKSAAITISWFTSTL